MIWLDWEVNQQFPLHSSIRGSRVVAASVPECRTSSKVQQLSGSSLDSQVKQQSIYFNCSSEANREAVAHSADGAIEPIALLIATQWTLGFYGPKGKYAENPWRLWTQIICYPNQDSYSAVSTSGQPRPKRCRKGQRSASDRQLSVNCRINTKKILSRFLNEQWWLSEKVRRYFYIEHNYTGFASVVGHMLCSHLQHSEDWKNKKQGF